MAYNRDINLKMKGKFMDIKKSNQQDFNFEVVVSGANFDKLWRLAQSLRAGGDARLMLVMLDIMDETLDKMEELEPDNAQIKATRLMSQAIRARLTK